MWYIVNFLDVEWKISILFLLDHYFFGRLKHVFLHCRQWDSLIPKRDLNINTKIFIKNRRLGLGQKFEEEICPGVTPHFLKRHLHVYICPLPWQRTNLHFQGYLPSGFYCIVVWMKYQPHLTKIRSQHTLVVDSIEFLKYPLCFLSEKLLSTVTVAISQRIAEACFQTDVSYDMCAN